ncbi:MAG: ABC transporter permease, partial [Gemmatimonadota bacterium]
VIRVQATHGWVPLRAGEIWQYRGLLYFLAWRDIKVRYKQTTLGVGWAILQPALQTLVATIVFGRFMNVQTFGVPYPVLSLSGILPWVFFSHVVMAASDSVVGNSNLITKIYFPRLIAPLATVMASFTDFLISFALLLVLMVFYQVVPGGAIVLLPLFILLAIMTALAVGVWFAALNAQFRDFRYILPFFMQFWLLASPVYYSSQSVQSPWIQNLYGLNPMVGVVEGFRWALLRQEPPSAMILISAVITGVLLISGLYFFRRVERTFADLI